MVPPVVVSGLQNVLRPKEVVDRLNKFIVGQPDAKRAVAIALRNRWRRQQLGDDFRNEVKTDQLVSNRICPKQRRRNDIYNIILLCIHRLFRRTY